FFPQFAGQKGEAFQKSLNVRVGALLRQKPGELRMCLGKFPALQPKKAQLIPVEPVQLHCLLHLYFAQSGFEPGKKMSERSELFFPRRKVSPSPPNSTVRPNTRQPPKLRQPGNSASHPAPDQSLSGHRFPRLSGTQ